MNGQAKANYMAGNSERHNYLLGENIMNDTDNQQKRLMDLGWLSGIIEGEGCFCIQITNGGKNKNYSPLIQITNTNPLIILKAARIIKDLGLPAYVYLQKQGEYRLCYRVVAFGLKRVKKFVDFIAPFIECRKEQLEAMREFVNEKLSHPVQSGLTEKETRALETLQRLNRPYLFSETSCSPQEIELLSIAQGIKAKEYLAKIKSDLHGDMQAATAAVTN